MFKLSSSLALAGIIVAAPASAQFFEEKFGQERVETRDFRNAEVRRAAEARPAGHAGHSHGAGGHEHGIETENLFGFTLGSDTEHAGAKGVAIENIMRFGKRETHYTALGQKLEFAYGITDNFSASLSLLGDYHRIKEKSAFLGTVGDVKGRYLFNGFGGEIRYRFLDRKTSPFGLTLHLEPSLAFSDEASGLKGRKYGSENKLIFDQEIVKDKLFVAFNLTHEMEITKEKGAGAWERGATVGASFAASYQVFQNIFLGAETRYLRSYDALRLKTYNGDAWYVGPTFSAKFADKYWINIAYSGLIGGHAKGSSQKLDLGNFERHQVRLKAGIEF